MSVYGPTNTFVLESGNVPVAQLDQNFTDAFLGINNAFLFGTHAARPAPDGIGKGRYYFTTDTLRLFRDNGTSWDQIAAGAAAETPWAAYTPTVTATVGTFGTASAAGRFKTVGQTTFIQAFVTVITTGSASGNLVFTLPNTSASATNQLLAGRAESGGLALIGTILSATNQCHVSFFDNSGTTAPNAYYVGGVYENT